MMLKHIPTIVRVKVSLPLLIAGCLAASAFAQAPVEVQGLERSFPAPAAAFQPDHVRETMALVRDWQLAHQQDAFWDRNTNRWRIYPDNSWVRAAFYTGVSAAWDATKDQAYFDAAKAWGARNEWKPARRLRHADDLCCGQTYLTVYAREKNAATIAPIRAALDAIVADPKRGPVVGWENDTNWAWCDALFMAPPTFTQMADATGDRRYLDTMHVMWKDTQDHLYSKEHGLFYRDARFKPNAEPKLLAPNGQPIFWGRGNGWVFAGLSRVLQFMPKDYPERVYYEQLFREMAAGVMKTQTEDGFWPVSLLDPQQSPGPETSGTGFFCYGLAWGVNHGLLDKEKTLPAIRDAWVALMSSVDSVGKIHWVQPIGAAPAATQWADTQEYGAGAFLLAGTEVLPLVDSLKQVKKPIPIRER